MAPLSSSSTSTSRECWMINVIAGGVSGVGARTVVAPLDLIRIQMQLNGGQSASFFIHQVLKNHSSVVGRNNSIYDFIQGIRGFYRGNMAASFLWCGYSAIQFTTFHQFHSKLLEIMSQQQQQQRNNTSNKNTEMLASFVAGSLAGATATIATYPLDLIRTCFAATYHRQEGAPRRIIPFALSIYRKRGLVGLFAGCPSALYQIIPYMGLNFCLYQHVMIPLVVETNNNDVTPSSLVAVYAGAMAGTVSKLLVYPLDTVKKRLQVDRAFITTTIQQQQQRYRGLGVLGCLGKIIRQDGILALFRGCVPAVIKSAIATSVSFSLYNFTKQQLLLQQDRYNHYYYQSKRQESSLLKKKHTRRQQQQGNVMEFATAEN